MLATMAVQSSIRGLHCTLAIALVEKGTAGITKVEAETTGTFGASEID